MKINKQKKVGGVAYLDNFVLDPVQVQVGIRFLLKDHIISE